MNTVTIDSPTLSDSLMADVKPSIAGAHPSPAAHNPKKPPSSIAPSSSTKKASFECTSCTRKFSTRSHLVRHSRVHTGERKYACDYPGCEMRCSRKDNLQQQSVLSLSYFFSFTLESPHSDGTRSLQGSLPAPSLFFPRFPPRVRHALLLCCSAAAPQRAPSRAGSARFTFQPSYSELTKTFLVTALISSSTLVAQMPVKPSTSPLTSSTLPLRPQTPPSLSSPITIVSPRCTTLPSPPTLPPPTLNMPPTSIRSTPPTHTGLAACPRPRLGTLGTIGISTVAFLDPDQVPVLPAVEAVARARQAPSFRAMLSS